MSSQAQAVSEPVGRAQRLGLQLPVGRIHRRLKQFNAGKRRIGAGAAIFTTAAIEYLMTELFEMAVEEMLDDERTITVRHLKLAIDKDMDFTALAKRVTIPGGGVLPAIHPALLESQHEPK